MQVNGAVKQDGNTKDMIFTIPKLIEHVSTIMTLEVCSPGIWYHAMCASDIVIAGG